MQLDATSSELLATADAWAARYLDVERRVGQLAEDSSLGRSALEALQKGQVETASAIISALSNIQPSLDRIEETAAAINERTELQFNEQIRRYLAESVRITSSTYNAHVNLLTGTWGLGEPIQVLALDYYVYPNFEELATDVVYYSVVGRSQNTGEVVFEDRGQGRLDEIFDKAKIQKRLLQRDLAFNLCFSWADRFLDANIQVRFGHKVNQSRMRDLVAEYARLGRATAGGRMVAPIPTTPRTMIPMFEPRYERVDNADSCVSIDWPPLVAQETATLSVDTGGPTLTNSDLSPLSRGEVRELQGRLNRLGYDAGPVDGIVGGRTRNAAQRFLANAEIVPAPAGDVLRQALSSLRSTQQ